MANTHISNNTNEVSQLVEWSVDTTKDYSLSVQEVNFLFIDVTCDFLSHVFHNCQHFIF